MICWRPGTIGQSKYVGVTMTSLIALYLVKVCWPGQEVAHSGCSLASSISLQLVTNIARQCFTHPNL